MSRQLCSYPVHVADTNREHPRAQAHAVGPNSLTRSQAAVPTVLSDQRLHSSHLSLLLFALT